MPISRFFISKFLLSRKACFLTSVDMPCRTKDENLGATFYFLSAIMHRKVIYSLQFRCCSSNLLLFVVVVSVVYVVGILIKLSLVCIVLITILSVAYFVI